MATTVLTIQGTHCAACKALLEEVCREVKGVMSCTVDFRTGRTEIIHDGSLAWTALQQAVADLGQPYRVQPPNA